MFSPDSPSPVRASAQEPREIATQVWLDAVTAYAVGGGKPDLPVNSIAAALSAAEARGRQQAEQERDEELKVTEQLLVERQKLLEVIPECLMHGPCVPHALAWIEGIKQRHAALTQALKNYGQHKHDCAIVQTIHAYGFVTGNVPCSCGLDAALTGAQA